MKAAVDLKPLLAKSGSPLAFLQDLLYSDDSLPDGAVPHLLSAAATQRPLLRRFFQEYRDVFPPSLPATTPPDRGLGDQHHIPMAPDVKPVHKRMYKHSP